MIFPSLETTYVRGHSLNYSDITLSTSFFEFTPPRTSLPIQVTADVDNTAEEMENITLSLDLSDPDTQSFGVVPGVQSTTVIGVESTDSKCLLHLVMYTV